MAKYRQIHVKIWKDDWFLELEPVNKLFYIYLFSNESASIAGIYELSKRVMAFESGLTYAEIDAALTIFAASDKAWYQDGVVLIPNLRKYHESKSPKVVTAIESDLRTVKECYLKGKYCKIYGIDTLSVSKNRVQIQSISSSSSSSSSLKGGVGGNDDIVTALCNVCANAGPTDRATLEMASELENKGAEWVSSFGAWYAEHEPTRRPYLKHLRTFADDYEFGRVPHFAKKTNGSGEIDKMITAIKAGQRHGMTAVQFVEFLPPEFVGMWKALDMKWSDVRRLTEKKTDALRFRLLEVAK